jgi:hypothetical protein
MLKKVSAFFIVILVFVSLSFADKTHVFADKIHAIDTPTTNIASYGHYNLEFRCFSKGNIIPKLELGVFKSVSIGGSFEFDRLIGNEDIKTTRPSIDVKARLYDGDMDLPRVALGYDGQGYFIDKKYRHDYVQAQRGFYITIGKELLFDGLMVNVGFNMPADLEKTKVYGFINTIVPVYKESLYFMAEYDNIHDFSNARANFGLRFTIAENMYADFIIRDCWGKKNDSSRVPREKLFKISYSAKFL